MTLMYRNSILNSSPVPVPLHQPDSMENIHLYSTIMIKVEGRVGENVKYFLKLSIYIQNRVGWLVLAEKFFWNT